MNFMLKIIGVVSFMLMVLSGCTSQTQDQNFDQRKAAKTRVSLGLTYLENGNFSQAKFNLDKALKFAPRSADANFAMAYYYQSVSELELAENAYQFAMDLEPKNANIANSYGAFLCQNGDYEKAKEYFLKAVNTSSYVSSAETYENLALCNQKQGQPEDTIHYLRSAVNHQPRRASSLYLLAQSLIEIQQWQEARVILSRYEKTSQISPQSVLMAMEIESGIGNDSAAKNYLDMLIKLFPDDPLTKTIIISQQPSFETVNKLVIRPAPIKAVETVSESVESQATGSMASSGKNELVTNKINTNIERDDVAQVELDILDKPDFHIVIKGENLYRISLLYNIKMQRLIDWNGLVDASAIFDGKKLSLVAPSVVE
jgi:type IV pilus assembly protein PilF